MNKVFIIFYSVISSFSEGAFVLTFNNKDPDQYIRENPFYRSKYYKKRVDLSFTTSSTADLQERECTYMKSHRTDPMTSYPHKSVYYRVLSNAGCKEKVLKMGSAKSSSYIDSPVLPLVSQKYINKKRLAAAAAQDYRVSTRIMSSSGAYRQELVYPKNNHISNNFPSPVFKGDTGENVEQAKKVKSKYPKSIAQVLYTKLAERLKESGLWRKSSNREWRKNNTRRRPTAFTAKPVLKLAPEFPKSEEKIILNKGYDDKHIMYGKLMKNPDPHYPNGAHPPDDTSVADTMYKSVRILCYVLTEPKNHNKTLYPIKETWGRRCNKLLFMSTVEDLRIPTIKLQVTSELYKSWQKVMAAYLYVHDKYKNEYDWFLRADDDSYIIMENIRYLLASFSPEDLIYFGCRFRAYGGQMQQLKDGHGPGMVLSRAALKAVVAGIRGNACKRFKFSDPVGEEFGVCLDRVGVQKVYTRDGSGGHRFLPAAPEDHVAPIAAGPNFWYWMDKHYPVSQGASCCSDYAIAFHNITPVNMYGLEYLIYRLRPYGIKFSSAKLPYSSTPNTKSVSYNNKPKRVVEPMPKTYALTDMRHDFGEEIVDLDATAVRTDSTTTHNSVVVRPLPKYTISMNDYYDVNAYDRKRTLDKKRILRHGHGHAKSKMLLY